MELLFLMVMILLLCAFGYAQRERNVFKTPGTIILPDEETIK